LKVYGSEDRVFGSLQDHHLEKARPSYDQVSTIHFPRSYFAPEGMSFANSDALFPPTGLASMIRTEFEAQCRMLCFGPPPAWDLVQGRFEELRHLL